MPKKKTNAPRVNSAPLKGKTILLGVTGSIAIIKSLELVRRLTEEGSKVICLMTANAQKFIAPLTFGALSGNPVMTDIWDGTLWKMAHIESSEIADLFIIAPASANCIAKIASGLADDVVTTSALAVKAPKIIAPAMHESMWKNPVTQENVRRLKTCGYSFVGPAYGVLLKGGKGLGRMSEIQDIISAAKKVLS